MLRMYKSESFFVKSKKEFWERREKVENEKGISWGIWGYIIVMSKDFIPKLDFFEICILYGLSLIHIYMCIRDRPTTLRTAC